MTLQGSFTYRHSECWELRGTTSSHGIPMGDEIKESFFAGWVFKTWEVHRVVVESIEEVITLNPSNLLSMLACTRLRAK
jgi:hypothetical protein